MEEISLCDLLDSMVDIYKDSVNYKIVFIATYQQKETYLEHKSVFDYAKICNLSSSRDNRKIEDVM